MRRRILGLVLVMIAMMCFMQSCTLPSPEQAAKLNELQGETEKLGKEIAETAKTVSDTKEEILDVYEKGKNGELTAVEVTQILSSLYEKYNQGQQHLLDLKEQYAVVKSEIKDLSASGVPWWQILVWIALGVFNTATGYGFLKEKGNGQLADYAIGGITKVVKFIEDVHVKGGTVKDVKKKISGINHVLIEDAVSKLPSVPTAPPEEPLPR